MGTEQTLENTAYVLPPVGSSEESLDPCRATYCGEPVHFGSPLHSVL